MFSMSALALSPVELARFGVLQGTEALLPSTRVPVLGLRKVWERQDESWEELERALPDGGLPRGVVELAALPFFSSSKKASRRSAMWKSGGTTTIAIAAMSAVHADPQAWCAWITPVASRDVASRDGASGARGEPIPSLYAPALAQAKVDLDRLLVVRPSPQALARTAVKVAMSGAFELVVIDAPHHHDLGGTGRDSAASARDNGALVVRKLALATEEYGTTSLLLTNAMAPRSVPWPVALRVEVERRPDALALRITKDRRGCGSSQHVVRLSS